MKVIQTETKNHATKTYVAETPADEARILFAILKKEAALKPKDDELIIRNIRSAYTSDRTELIDIADELVPSLPETLQKKVKDEKTRYNERMAVETQKNDNRKKLVEIVKGELLVTEKDLPLLKELAEQAQQVEDDHIAYSGGWGASRQIYTVLSVSKA